MKKRLICVLCLGTIMAGLLSGCNGDGKGHAVGENGQNGGKTVLQGNKQIESANLTENLDTSMVLDYSIDTYEPVQNYSYDLFRYNMTGDNPVLSPVSAYLALGMAGTGALGSTLTEFQTILGNDLECMPYHLMTTLPRDEEGMKISLANSAWVDDSFEVDKEYLVEIDSFYKSEVYQANLSTEQTMQDMNTWIDNNTSGLIPSLLEEPLHDEARLALFNTIYFKGDWMSEFEPRETQEREFTKADGKVENVDMMHMYQRNLQYINTNEAKGILLPYRGEDMAFVALMPFENSTVRELYESLTWADISDMVSQREETLCNLQLPKFKVTFERELNESLMTMGLKEAFDKDEANLAGMGKSKDDNRIYIDMVFQKAVIIVDEKGTEAAAVTEITTDGAGCFVPEEPPVDIFFNKPFLYMIVDMETELPLFIGIMDNPNG